MKLGSGIAPVAAMLARGINVALGTDNNNGNDSNSMFDAMRLASLAGSLVSRSSVPAIDAACCLRMATQGGAAAMSGAGAPETSRRGNSPTFASSTRGSAAFTPLNDPVTQLVFCEQGPIGIGACTSAAEDSSITADYQHRRARIMARGGGPTMPVMLSKIQHGAAHYAERLRPFLETAYRTAAEEPGVAALRGAQNLIDLPAVSG